MYYIERQMTEAINKVCLLPLQFGLVFSVLNQKGNAAKKRKNADEEDEVQK